MRPTIEQRETEIAFQLAAFCLLWFWVRHRAIAPGETLTLYVAAYAIFRFLVEFVRGNEVAWHGLTRPQLVLAVTIHEGDTRRQNFGQVSRAFIRCINGANDSEIARYDLSEDGSTESAMIFGEVYRNGADWKFRAVGQGFNGGLGPLAKNYGVSV